jgi:hypothetical protein
MQNWHDKNAFQLPNSTAQYELIDMLHYHESCNSNFLLLRGLVGCKGTLQGLVVRCLQGPWKPRKPSTAPVTIWSPAYTGDNHYNSSVCTWRAPNGGRNVGLPISMRGSHLSSGRCEQHTTRTTIVLAFWQIYDDAILIMFGTS